MSDRDDGAFTETFVEAAGLSVQVRRGGQGPPLLVLHGELGVPGWLSAYAELARDFTVHVPSLPGFGQSSRPDWIVSVRDLAGWVAWFVRDLGLPRPLPVIGGSLGGWVAAEIAIVDAELFSKLVLVAPAGVAPPEGEIWDYFLHSPREAFAHAFADPSTSTEHARFYGAGWRPEDDRQAEWNREMAARLIWKPYLRSHTLPALLGAIATPTLVVWGRQDAIIPVGACDRWVKAIPGATARVLDRCGHLPEMERPEAFVSAVREFLLARV
jgi:pimeloyl-ACP methyl ester carboxylesterase